MSVSAPLSAAARRSTAGVASFVLIGLSAAIAVASLVGWITATRRLVDPIFRGGPMTVNGALAVLVIGAAMVWFLRAPRLGAGALEAAGLATLVLAALVLLEYVVGDLGVDRLLLDPSLAPNYDHPGRPTPAMCFELVLLGGAAVAIARGSRIADLLAGWSVVGATAGLAAFCFTALGPIPAGQTNPISLLAAAAAMLLAAALLARPGGTFVASLRERPASRSVFYGAVATAACGIPLAAYLRVAASNDTLYGDGSLVAVLVGTFLGAVVVVGLLTAARINTVVRELDEERLRTGAILAASTETAILAIDRTGILTQFNSGAERLLGYTADEAVGRMRPIDFHDPEEVTARAWELGIEAGPLVFVDQVRPGHAETRDWTYVRRDGSRVPVSLTVSVIGGADGRVEGYIGMARDVREERRAAEELRRSSERMREIFRITPVPIAVTSRRDGRMRALNQAFTELFGWSEEEALGRTAADLGLFADPDARDEIVATFEGGERRISGQTIELCTHTGERRLILLSATTMDFEGEPGYLAAFYDLTDRLRMESALEQATAEALEASRMKSEFLATMSHEIRTPMNAVIGMTGLLLGTDLDDAQREYVDTVRHAGDALLALINDVLDISKIEAGHLELERSQFDLRMVVEQTAELLAPGARAKGLHLALSLGSDLPAEVVGDSTRLRQVLVNLLGNAIKFTDAGEVTVAVRTEDDETGARCVRFEVTDTGIGIDPEARERLFESFTQADASTTRRYGGTGLGLAICRRLVEAMDGSIGVRSDPGRGSTFWFVIPLEVAAEASASPSARDRIRGAYVLVAHAAGTSAPAWSEELESWGIEPVVVEGFDAALAAAEDDRIDLVIADLGAAGPELARSVSTALPVLLVVHQGEEPPREPAVFAVLQAPVRTSRLFDAVSEALGASERRPVGAREPTPMERGHGERLLIVDDSAVNQRVATLLLEGAGYVTHAVNNGREALDALRMAPYDAVLMDLEMPVLDGYAATEAIRAGEAGRADIPVIAVSAAVMPEDRRRALAAGADAHVAKPIRADELASVLAGLLRGAAVAADLESRGEPALPIPEPVVETGRLDGALVDQLRDMDDTGDALRRLTELFFTTFTERVAQLEAAADVGDAVVARRVAHELRGSGGTLGMRRLAELCRAIEADAEGGGVPDAERLAALRAEGEAAARELEAASWRPAPSA